ncbi:MAG: hypothetical protein BMS9Abin07_1153 [Acidimicrobiia bacterium]|nr:MAG: hypothetical protein BMS9Abin07_1153 [Acidimicrobiia bacterium]
MTHTPRSRILAERGERGAVLVLMAIFLAVLMGAAAMAVDLGWLFWQSIEIQHGADSAALAGVVFEPDQQTEAHTEAIASALENGYDDGLPATTVTVSDIGDLPLVVANENELRVTITHQVDTFFMKVFGLTDVDIARTAVAQYTPPLLMGSPGSTFGRDYSLYAPGDPADPGFWASVSGSWGPKSWGDRYSSLCKDKSNYVSGNSYGTGYGQPCTEDEEARRSSNWGLSTASGGYVYGITVPSGSTGLSVEIFDGPIFAQKKFGKPAHSDEWTGDFWPDSTTGFYSNFGPQNTITWFMLYGPDVTPLNTEDNELLCVVRYDIYADTGNDEGGRDTYYANWEWDGNDWQSFSDVPQADIAAMWDSMATSAEKQPGCAANFDRGPGIYPLRVMVEHDDNNSYALNKYSLRVSTISGAQPTISAITDMSIFANDVQWASTQFALAKVEQKYAGKKLILEIFDAGDSSDTGATDTLNILDGTGVAPANCTWEKLDNEWALVASGNGCSMNIDTGSGDNHFFVFTVPLPDSYTCSGAGCWFKVFYDYSGGGNLRDVTTWRAYIEGNPIRIIE